MSEQIRYIAFQFTDILGKLKTMIVPCQPANSIEELRTDSILENGTSVDGSSVKGLATVEASDLRLVPDPSTLIEIPYTEQRVAAVMCHIRKRIENDEQAFFNLDGRGVLHRVCEEQIGGLRLEVKTEPEFYFLTADGEPLDDGKYADIYPASIGQDLLLEIATEMQTMGIRPRVAHHEVGEAQYEIEILFEDVRIMADNILRFKNLTHALALENGMDVTFMPKPFVDLAGSGMHCHLQLWEGNQNLFGGDNRSELSDTALKFIAGLLEHAPAITAIANPTINSYKRLVPHQEAPVYVCWAYRNRTSLIRVPLFSDDKRAAIEFRSPDMMTNPYLLFATIIAAGIDGVNRNLVPPDPVSADVFKLTDEERARMGITTLPTNLQEALDCLKRDNLIRKTLGKEIVDMFVRIKEEEWNEYISRTVTDWEREKYGED